MKQQGLNKLPSKQTSSILRLLTAQFTGPLVILLLLAAALSFFIGDKIDAILILIILLLNGLLGFWQEFKASKEVEALRKIEVLFSRVIRDGEETKLPAYKLVPADLVVLEAGDKIPADGILIESYNFSTNESMLTGESLPVIKSIHEKDNQIFFGATVSTGRGVMKITATGLKTKFGKVAENLVSIEEEPTPLEISLADFSKKVGIIAIGVSLLLLLIRFAQGNDLVESFFTSIALLVAAVPEGLPTVIALLLAISVRRMYQHKTIVRRLSSIESLGITNVICTDKTGTLTKNEMRVKEVFAAKKNLYDLLKTAILCNSSSIVFKKDHGSFDILGDPTEGALLLWAKDQGQEPEAIRSEGKIIEELSFSLERRMMSVLWSENNRSTLFSKGAPEVILPLCDLSQSEFQKLEKEYQTFAAKGLRVLAFANKNNQKQKIDEAHLNFLGFLAIADSIRPEAAEAVSIARRAGIRVVMVTGDNPLTAKTIAEEVGLLEEGDEIMTGDQLDELDDNQLQSRLLSIRVFARATPEHKLRIVKAFQSMGKVVTVTGDGVNDALALKAAQVGVAMGKTGTDVTKEAADLIILDDNFMTIVKAVEQGRLTYSNIVKTIKFLMAGNLAEVGLVIGAAFLTLPTPLLPVQILWINLVTDGLPALSLAADPASSHLMNVKPRDHTEKILNFSNLKYIGLWGSLMTFFCLLIFLIVLTTSGLESARLIAFNLIVGLQMIFIFIVRKHHSPFSNKYLVGSVGLVILFQILITFYPPLRELFKL